MTGMPKTNEIINEVRHLKIYSLKEASLDLYRLLGYPKSQRVKCIARVFCVYIFSGHAERPWFSQAAMFRREKIDVC